MKPFILAVLLFWLLFPSLFSQKTIILQPGPADGTDTYINSAFPDQQWGNNPNLVPCAWTYEGVFGIGRALTLFDLSQIPADAQILDARLTLFYDPAAAYGEQYGENASCFEKITENWEEMAATWNVQPDVTTAEALFLDKTQSPSQDLTDIDFTSFVSDWVLHPETNYGFSHRMVTEITYCCLVYSSSDHPDPARRPKLVVTYRDCDRPVAGFTFLVQIPKVTFSDTSGSGTSWFWDFGDGYFSNLRNPQHLYATQGVYEVCLTVTDSCGSDTLCKNVPVCEMPQPHFYYQPIEQLVSFRDSSISPQSWFWDFGDGFYSDLRNPVHYFNEPGTYYVCEQVTNACNTETFCDSVTIVANAIEDHSKTPVVIIYPNPASATAFVRLNVPNVSTIAFELFNLQTNSIRQWKMKCTPAQNSVPLNLDGIPQGVYLLQTKFEGSVLLNKLIIL
jgi:hypothetical protein